MSLSEPERLQRNKAARFRREIGKKLGRDEDRILHVAMRDPGEFAALGASLMMGRVVGLAFQASAFQPPDIVVRGEELAMYLTDAQVGLHLELLSQAFEQALASQDR